MKSELASSLVEIFKEMSFCQQVASTLRKLRSIVSWNLVTGNYDGDREQIDERFNQLLEIELRQAVNEKRGRLLDATDHSLFTEPAEVRSVALSYPTFLDGLHELIGRLGGGLVSADIRATDAVTALDETLYRGESCLELLTQLGNLVAATTVSTSEALRLINLGEGQDVEFKTSLAEQNEGIRTLSSFANAQGGSVFFGVGRTGVISGVDVGANTLESIANSIRDHTEPPQHPSIEQFTVNGKTVVAVSVSKAAKGVVVYAFGTALIRVGRTNQVMSAAEQRARLLSANEGALRLVVRVHEYRFAGGANFPALVATLSVENAGDRNAFVDEFDVVAEVPFERPAVRYEFRDARVEGIERDLPMNIPARGVSDKIKVIAHFDQGFGSEGSAFKLRIAAVGPYEYERVDTVLAANVSASKTVV